MEFNFTTKLKLDAFLNCTGNICNKENCYLYNTETKSCDYKNLIRLLEIKAEEHFKHFKPKEETIDNNDSNNDNDNNNDNNEEIKNES